MIRLWLIVSLLPWLSPPAQDSQAQLPRTQATQHVSWKDAAGHYEQDCTVYGRVVATKCITNWCFLNFNEDWRNTFTVAIPSRCLDNFPEPPDKAYADKQIAVTGRVIQYKGKPEIIVCNPDSIVIGAKMPTDASATSQPAKAPPHKFDGTCTVATFNVLNLYDDQDDPYRDDEQMQTKPREELDRLADTLRRVNADLVALQEVENRGYLQRFVSVLIPDLGYKHVVLIEGNNNRGIDVALLSRLPIGPVTSYRHLQFPSGQGESMGFQRDLLRVNVRPPDLPPFDVFVVHLKSKYGGESLESLATRMGEARQIRSVFDEILNDKPDARFLICGDFNDTLDSEPLKTLIGTGKTKMTHFEQDVPEEQRVTYNEEPHRSMIDFIMASPAMAKHYTKGSYRILDCSVSSCGSDHNPVIAEFELK